MGGELESIGTAKMEFSEAINQGFANNHIRADCAGSTLRLYANEVLLLEVVDTSLTYGDVGLVVGTYTEAGTGLIFDNFEVRKAEP